MIKLKKIIFTLFIAILAVNFFAQESVRPINSNLNYIYKDLQKPILNSKEIKSQNKSAVSLSLPFKEDFYYACTQAYPDQNLWSDSSTFVNTGHAIAPPSIGVATFDGLNKHGYPYTPNSLNNSLSSPADTLTSKAINLLTVGAQTLQPSDSVALTFYYQARGFGDAPELTDTLILDFYNPTAGIWNSKVWYARGNLNGNINDTIFKRAYVRVDSAYYLKDGFKFRFRNRASTVGDYDNWHLDYIYLDKGRRIIVDTTYDDITFGYVPTPLLSQYSEMPWEQYLPVNKTQKNNVFIRNNGNDNNLNMTYENRMYNLPSGSLTYTYTGGANPGLGLFRYTGWSNLTAHSNPVFNYTFAPFTDSTDFKIKHFIYRSGASNDFFSNNDTVIQTQKFRNYFAFDDGSAEGAYFVSGVGVRIVQKITVNITDTLRGLRIYFDPIESLAASTLYTFRLNVWNELGNQPGYLIYKDSLMSPKYYNKDFKPSPEYTLTTPMILTPGNYYIGIQQKVAQGIGIGFDKNLNHMNNLYYDSGFGWTQSSVPGSLMMRAVFGKKIPSPVGINENIFTDKNNSFIVYPNPANNQLIVRAKANEKTSYQLINVMGQIIDENKLEESEHIVNTENINIGVYFLILKANNQLVQKQKIIIQH